MVTPRGGLCSSRNITVASSIHDKRAINFVNGDKEALRLVYIEASQNNKRSTLPNTSVGLGLEQRMSLIDKLKKLWAWLTPPAKAAADDSPYRELTPVDAEDIATKYRLREEGARLGAGGVPAIDAKGPVGAEASALVEIETARLAYQAWGSHRLNALDSEIDAWDIRHDINAALIADETFKNKAAALITTEKQVLDQLSAKMTERENELKKFKEKNQLDRSCMAPTTAAKMLIHAILLFVLIGESFANATFFQQGLAGGLLDGMTMALVFAAINLLPAYFIGKWLLPYKNHCESNKRLTGYLGIALWIFLAIIIALIVAHYRNALIAQSDDPATQAWNSLFGSPFSLGNLNSLMLFILSLFFSLIALIDGYKTVDPYPGYDIVNERLESAQSDYAEEVNEVLASLEGFKKEELDKVNSTVHRSSGVNGALAALINEKESAGQRLQAAMTHASAAADAVVQIFRAENSLARRPGEDPKYFSKSPELKKIEIPNFDTTQSVALRDELSDKVTELVDQAQNIVQRIEKAFNSDYNTLKPLAEQFK
jgi:hypothetical protein